MVLVALLDLQVLQAPRDLPDPRGLLAPLVLLGLLALLVLPVLVALVVLGCLADPEVQQVPVARQGRPRPWCLQVPVVQLGPRVREYLADPSGPVAPVRRADPADPAYQRRRWRQPADDNGSDMALRLWDAARPPLCRRRYRLGCRCRSMTVCAAQRRGASAVVRVAVGAPWRAREMHHRQREHQRPSALHAPDGDDIRAHIGVVCGDGGGGCGGGRGGTDANGAAHSWPIPFPTLDAGTWPCDAVLCWTSLFRRLRCRLFFALCALGGATGALVAPVSLSGACLFIP